MEKTLFETLEEIEAYFAGCRRNAGGPRARGRYDRYLDVIAQVKQLAGDLPAAAAPKDSKGRPESPLAGHRAGISGRGIPARVGITDRVPEIETAHPAVRCAECTFFEVRDWWTTPDENGVSLLAASDWPTCTRWGTGDSATSPDGWCFLGKQRPGRPGGNDREVEA